MTNETEEPERIWVEAQHTRGEDIEYTRADLSDAKDKRIAELDGNRQALEAEIADMHATYKFRIAELEALVDHLTHDPDFTTAYRKGFDDGKATDAEARIAELEAERDAVAARLERALVTGAENRELAEASEAKLAKAEAFMQSLVGGQVYTAADCFTKPHESEASRQARATLAELKGTD